jgi:hypothetical protein
VHPTATVAAVEDGYPLLLWSSCCCILIGALIIIGAMGASFCCHHHPWCPALLLSSPLVHGGLMWWWVPPHSSSWLCGPPCRHCGVGAHCGCLPLVLEAMGAPALVIVVMWCLPGGRCGCAPCHCCGYGCPRSSSWSCGVPLVILVVMWCPLVIIMAIPSCPRGRALVLVLVVVWCSGHCRHHGCPPGCPCGRAVLPAHLRGRVDSPRSLSWPCGASWPLVPSPAHPHHHGCPRGRE